MTLLEAGEDAAKMSAGGGGGSSGTGLGKKSYIT